MTTRRSASAAITTNRGGLPAYFTPQEFADRYRESVDNTLRRIKQRAAAPTDDWTLAAINVGTQLRPKYLIPRSEAERFDRRNAAA